MSRRPRRLTIAVLIVLALLAALAVAAWIGFDLLSHATAATGN
jgi:type VI protein secretion system component VasF